ncbi:MAG: ABC transporter permease [Faecousia sp.]
MRKQSFREKRLEKLEDNLITQLKGTAVENDSLTAEEAYRLPDEAFQLAPYSETEAERIGYSNYSYWRSTFQMFLKNKLAASLLVVIAVILIFAFIQPNIPGQKDAIAINNWPEGTEIAGIPVGGMPITNQRPSMEFWFGTNSIGQDLWSNIWSGTRTSLIIGFSVAILEAVIGTIAGVVWGYVRKLDCLFTEIYNIISNIPTTIILILATYVMEPGILTMIVAMTVTGWIGLARFIRNQVLIIRDRDFNLASRCLGTPTKRIITKNLLPQMVSVIMLRMALSIPAAIGWEVFLTYIGLGLDISTPSLGNLINTGRALMSAPNLRYQLVFPAMVLSIITICFYLVGNAFADAADPKNHV